MRRWALGIEYDGGGYCGWQVQNNGISVQAVAEAAVSRVANHAVHLTCAGRTDAGVHSTGQVVHFDTTAHREQHAWVMGVNTYLPDDVNVTWARSVHGDFHARFSAHSRSYRYLILNRPVRSALARRYYTWVHGQLDAVAMHAGARHLEGEHDFSAFRASDCQAKTASRKITDIAVDRKGDVVILRVTANAFLKHMVRNIAGVLLKIGRGEERPEWAGRVLATRDRTCAGVTAPPEGLCLVNVAYPHGFELPASIGAPVLAGTGGGT